MFVKFLKIASVTAPILAPTISTANIVQKQQDHININSLEKETEGVGQNINESKKIHFNGQVFDNEDAFDNYLLKNKFIVKSHTNKFVYPEKESFAFKRGEEEKLNGSFENYIRKFYGNNYQTFKNEQEAVDSKMTGFTNHKRFSYDYKNWFKDESEAKRKYIESNFKYETSKFFEHDGKYYDINQKDQRKKLEALGEKTYVIFDNELFHLDTPYIVGTQEELKEIIRASVEKNFLNSNQNLSPKFEFFELSYKKSSIYEYVSSYKITPKNNNKIEVLSMESGNIKTFKTGEALTFTEPHTILRGVGPFKKSFWHEQHKDSQNLEPNLFYETSSTEFGKMKIMLKKNNPDDQVPNFEDFEVKNQGGHKVNINKYLSLESMYNFEKDNEIENNLYGSPAQVKKAFNAIFEDFYNNVLFKNIETFSGWNDVGRAGFSIKKDNTSKTWIPFVKEGNLDWCKKGEDEKMGEILANNFSGWMTQNHKPGEKVNLVTTYIDAYFFLIFFSTIHSFSDGALRIFAENVKKYFTPKDAEDILGLYLSYKKPIQNLNEKNNACAEPNNNKTFYDESLNHEFVEKKFFWFKDENGNKKQAVANNLTDLKNMFFKVNKPHLYKVNYLKDFLGERFFIKNSQLDDSERIKFKEKPEFIFQNDSFKSENQNDIFTSSYDTKIPRNIYGFWDEISKKYVYNLDIAKTLEEFKRQIFNNGKATIETEFSNTYFYENEGKLQSFVYKKPTELEEFLKQFN